MPPIAAPLDAPFDAAEVPGVPAIVVKPKSVADAYGLRARYRQGGTMAFFPAEVLVSIYRTMGDVRDVLVIASALNNFLVFGATVLLLLALAGLRRSDTRPCARSARRVATFCSPSGSARRRC